MEQTSRRRLQFRLKHLLLLILCSAVLMSIFVSIVAQLGYESADIEITGLSHEPTRTQLQYTIRTGSGTYWSATPLPGRIPAARFNELIGKQWQVEYRAHQILWLEPELAAAVANQRIQIVIRDFEDQQYRMRRPG